MTACVWRHCQTLRIGWCAWQFVTSKHDLLFGCVWCSHFQVVFPTVTDTICMFVQIPSESLGKWNSPRHALDRTNTLYIVGSLFLPQVSSVHYRAAISACSRPRNHIPGHCRRLQVPCVMRSGGQHSITQAVGFRCAHCSSEFKTRCAMDCHRRKQSSQGTECANPSNSKYVSFTGRASIAASLVREHDFLGAYLNHMEVVYVHRQEDPRKLT
jgi:hypothetical protein